ncbi:hypothetical protein GCM10022246_24650 [Pedobacter ginsengiterrae]|uniref:PKD domain-containing protein n=1 Tax=Pedobacter ginsengiterrae TaxID=871696 RepID=A0ABP7PTY2_9SPHI
MPENLPIDDAYIDQVIKANEPYDPNEEKTQGIKLRELVKRIRNRIDNQEAGSGVGKLFSFTTSGNGVQNTFTVPHGLDYVPQSVTITANSDDAAFDKVNLYVYLNSAKIDGADVIITCRRSGSNNGPKFGIDNLTWSILVGGRGSQAAAPDAPTNGIEDLESFTFTFTKNPKFNLAQHEWRYRIANGSFSNWVNTPSTTLSLPAVNINVGDLQVRVKSIGANPASVPLTNDLPYITIPGDNYILIVNISGIEEGYEVAYNDELWANNQKSFPAGTVIQNLRPSALGYTFSPSSISELVMDNDKSISFAASPYTTLLNGFSRIVPNPDAFSYESDFNYNPLIIGGGGYPKLGWRVPDNDNGSIFIKYEQDSYDLNLYLALDESNNDLAAVGFYFANGKICWDYVIDDDYTVGEVEQALEGAYYGLIKDGSNIKLYKTLDGISFTELYDFGNRDNYVFVTVYNQSSNSVLHDPQGVNLISTLSTDL